MSQGCLLQFADDIYLFWDSAKQTIDFVLFAIEFVTFAIDFVPFAIEFVAFAVSQYQYIKAHLIQDYDENCF